MILIIIFLLIILFVYISCKNIEGFGVPTEYDIYNQLDGAEEGLFSEYRTVKRKYPKKIWRHRELDSLMFESRLPSLVNQRYSYNDCGRVKSVAKEQIGALSKEQIRALSKEQLGASLKKLPLNLTNKYYAILDKDTARTSMAFWPLTMEKVKPTHTIQSSLRTIRPLDKSSPNLLVDSTLKIKRLVHDSISGYDPLSILPANYADRSKISDEYKLAVDLYL